MSSWAAFGGLLFLWRLHVLLWVDARLGACDAALRAFAEDQMGRPLGAGVGLRSLAAEEIFQRIEAGVEHLGAERTFHAAADHEHGGAMHQGPQREHEAGVLARRSSQTLGEMLAHQIERWPWLVQGGGFGEPVIEHFVGVTMLKGKLEIDLASLGQRVRAAETGEEFVARLDAQCPKNIVPIAVALVNCGSGGAGGLGDGAHGKSFFSAPGAQPAGGFQDALFKCRISLSGQRLDSGVYRINAGPEK